MDLTPHIDGLRQDLAAAAEAAAPDTRQAIERLLFALNPAMRLALMDAIGQAAAEITARMAGGGVEVRLNGRELDFVVEALAPPAAVPAIPPADEAEGDGGLARISLRLPETMKAKAEELAGRSGQSLNNWLVGVVRAATRDDGPGADPSPSGEPFGGNRRGNRRMTGWV
jgi:hypothetical protein